MDRLVDDEVARAIENLPGRFAAAVLLADVEDLSYKEIAAQLGIPIGTVMSRLHRGRRGMRQQLRDAGVQTR